MKDIDEVLKEFHSLSDSDKVSILNKVIDDLVDKLNGVYRKEGLIAYHAGYRHKTVYTKQQTR